MNAVLEKEGWVEAMQEITAKSIKEHINLMVFEKDVLKKYNKGLQIMHVLARSIEMGLITDRIHRTFFNEVEDMLETVREVWEKELKRFV